jgi:flagellar biosynthesis regulator FlaF
MQTPGHALRAYAATAAARSPRQQEAELFWRANAFLRRAESMPGRARVRALADNRRLWTAVMDLLRDPANALPAPLRASIIAVGMAVQREMDKPNPDLRFLIAINENIAAGLAGERRQ